MSDIPYGRLKSLSARQIIGALFRDGFGIARQVGSRQQFKHQDGRRVTATFHSLGQIFPPKTLKSIPEKQARWSRDDLEKLGIL